MATNDQCDLPSSSPIDISPPNAPASDPTTLQSFTQPSVNSKPHKPLPSPSLGPPKKRAKTTQPIKNGGVVGDGKEVNPRLRSEAWNHFTIVKGSDPMRATCNYCGRNYAGNPAKNGTSHLFNHLNDQCTMAPWKKNGQAKMTDYSTEISINKQKTLNVTDLRNKVARMIIIDELPFNFVEKQGFKQLLIALEPKFDIPSRVTVARDCMRLYIEEKRKLKKVLKKRRVCLTTDTWTSLQNLNYMVLTAHYIDDDWELQKKFLNFCIIESHRGAAIAAKLEDCLHSWGVDKVLTLTVDNASSNDLCVQELLKVFKFNDVLLDNKFFHVRCSAHILNLIVKDGLKEHFSSIVRVRNACKYVRSSPARLKAFKKCVVKEKITLLHTVILDVDTRWNSTYLMLDRAEKYEMAFDRLHKTDKSFQDFFDCYESVYDDNNISGKKEKKVIGPPRKEDWEVARNFVAFLKVFYEVTLKFSSTLNVTSNICIAQLCKVKQSIDSKMDIESSSSIFSMAMSMSSKYKKYWENWSNINHLMFVAAVFDPRFKIKGMEVCLKIMYGMDYETRKADIENHVNSLFAHYSKESSSNDLEPSRSSSKSKEVIKCEGEDIFSMIAREIDDDNNDSRNELSTYLSEGIEKGDNLDLLGWWKSNASRYPILSRIAKDILAIPVSTVASEQAFSTSGRVIDAFRSSLSPTTVEALVCAQNWIRGKEIPMDICEALDEIDQYEDITQESSSSCMTGEDVQVDSD